MRLDQKQSNNKASDDSSDLDGLDNSDIQDISDIKEKTLSYNKEMKVKGNLRPSNNGSNEVKSLLLKKDFKGTHLWDRRWKKENFWRKI